MRIPVDVSRFAADGLQLLSVQPAYEYEGNTRTTNQRKDSSGVPVWTLTVLRLVPEGEPELLRVRLASSVQPDIAPMTPIALRDFVATTWQNGNRSGVSLSATGVAAL